MTAFAFILALVCVHGAGSALERKRYGLAVKNGLASIIVTIIGATYAIVRMMQ